MILKDFKGHAIYVMYRGGSRNSHLGRPVKVPSKFLVGQQEWCAWDRILRMSLGRPRPTWLTARTASGCVLRVHWWCLFAM